MSARPKTFSDIFLEYFEVRFAGTREMIDEAGRVRYRVYCEEFHYEPIDSFPDGIERDNYDAHSLHALVIHKGSDRPAGCVRLVCPDSQTPGREKMPFEHYFGPEIFDTDVFRSFTLEHDKTCEVSRLAVDQFFRKRHGERSTRFGGIHDPDISRREERTFPLIAIACFFASVALADLSGKNSGFAMMEPFLPRLMAQSGIRFAQVGPDIDYHGTRAPYFITLAGALEHMDPSLKQLYAAIHRMLSKDFQPL